MTTTNTEHKINEQASGYENLGWLVYWELLALLPSAKPVTGAKASRDWKGADALDPDNAPAPKAADAAYSHAVRRGAVGIRDHGLHVKLLECPQPPEYKGARRIHAVVDLDAQHNATSQGYDIQANARALVGFLMGDTDAQGQPLADHDRIRSNNPTDPIAAQILAEYRDALQYVAADAITRAIQAELTRRGVVAMRTHGGIYFVPNDGSAEVLDHLRTLQAVVEGWGDCRLHLLGVPNTADERRAVHHAAANSFDLELAEVQAQIDDYRERLGSWDGDDADKAPVRRTTLERRLEELQALHTKAQLYGELLDVKAETLTAGLADLEQLITKTLHDVFETAA